VGVGVAVVVDTGVGVGVGVVQAARRFLLHDGAAEAELVEFRVTASPATSARASTSRARPRTAVLGIREDLLSRGMDAAARRSPGTAPTTGLQLV
jgi:hypothetical protein